MRFYYVTAVLLASLSYMSCAMEAPEHMDSKPEYADSKQPGDAAVQDAASRAPACDALNQDTVYYDGETRIFITCNGGSWEYIDIEERMAKTLGAWSYYWTPYNSFDGPVSVDCGVLSGGKIGVLTGVQSQHSNHHEDRRFSYKCTFLYDY